MEETIENNPEVTERAKRSKLYRDKARFSIIVLVTLCFFLLGLCLTSLHFLSTEVRDYLAYHSVPKFCVPCSSLVLHPDDRHDGVVRSNDGNVCCASNTSSIPVLVEKYSGHWFKELLYEKTPEYHGCMDVEREKDKLRNNPKKEYFKIQGYENQRLNATDHTRVHWDESSAISSENIQYAHGFVQIGVRGMYHIYSQVIADYNLRPSYIQGAPNAFMHAISVKQGHRNSEERHIMAATLSQCATEPQNRYSVSHIETVFQFREGDRVVVKMSYPQDMQPNARMNYFGIHMI